MRTEVRVRTEETTRRVHATPAARAAIERLCRRGQVMFVQSGGCCGGSVPMCFRLGEFAVGVGDVLLGHVGGCPFYIDASLYQAWGEPLLLLDVEPGFAEGFSLPAGDGQHFVVRGEERGQSAAGAARQPGQAS